VDAPTPDPQPAPAREPAGAAELAPAAAAGLAAAVVTGVIWAYIVKITDYEIGFAAWALGFVVGTAVVLAARRRRGVPLAAIAVVAALVGILVGKYLTFVFVAQDALGGLGADISIFSGDTWRLFMDNKDVVFSFWDVLWIGLAVMTAWRVSRPQDSPRTPEAAA
jgi:ABC-type Fe3+-siderophore transport system permease subunit